MRQYDNIFVVLTYKNVSDLEELITSIYSNVRNYKIIVVNSYCNEETEEEIKKTAARYDCDFLSVENKGYGYGNNQGIEFAKNNYSFKRIIVSNPDICIKSFDDDFLDTVKEGIIGPKIKTITGKRQNPERAHRIKLSITVTYQLAVKHNVIRFGLGVILARLGRMITAAKSCISPLVKVYAVHGSFVIFTKDAIDRLGTIYDENIFMTGEELDLAEKARNAGIHSYYTSRIELRHKEDGSVKLSDINISDEAAKTAVYLQTKYWSK